MVEMKKALRTGLSVSCVGLLIWTQINRKNINDPMISAISVPKTHLVGSL